MSMNPYLMSGSSISSNKPIMVITGTYQNSFNPNLTAKPKNSFQFSLWKKSQIGKDSHKDSQKFLIQKETKNIKEFYAMRFVDYRMRQGNLNHHSNTPIANNSKKKRASHPSSIREPDLDIRKLVDKLEQAEITMKVEETENLKLQNINNIQTTTSQISNINDSDTELFEKLLIS